jgi:hypothetical protein
MHVHPEGWYEKTSLKGTRIKSELSGFSRIKHHIHFYPRQSAQSASSVFYFVVANTGTVRLSLTRGVI